MRAHLIRFDHERFELSYPAAPATGPLSLMIVSSVGEITSSGFAEPDFDALLQASFRLRTIDLRFFPDEVSSDQSNNDRCNVSGARTGSKDPGHDGPALPRKQDANQNSDDPESH